MNIFGMLKQLVDARQKQDTIAKEELAAVIKAHREKRAKFIRFGPFGNMFRANCYVRPGVDVSKPGRHARRRARQRDAADNLIIAAGYFTDTPDGPVYAIPQE